MNFLGGFAVATGILLFSNPWLINRQPVKLGADYQPVITWALINLYFIVGNATRGLWGAVLAGLLLTSLAVTQAVRGARW